MNHSEVHSYMPEYLEGELDLTKRALLDAHLDACAECSREFDEMRGTIALLRGLPDPEAPPFLTETVMRRIRDGEGRLGLGQRLREWVSALATPQVALPATALAAGLLLTSGVLDRTSLPGFGDETSLALRIDGTADDAEAVATPDANRALHLTIGNLPPAVARVPRVSISLPGPVAGRLAPADATIPPRLVTRWPQRSIRNPASNLAEVRGLSVSVGNRVGLEPGTPDRLAAQSSAFVPHRVATPDESRDTRRLAELDGRIDRMIRSPLSFASEFSELTEVEQELWLAALAERARSSGRGEAALQALRMAGDRDALKLATAFSVALQNEMASLASEGEASQR